ncbi:MAG: DNA-3-methyladenine glycosylase [Micropepsaceae bacterium]
MTLKPLKRADLPVGTVALARYLIGVTIVHDLPEGIVAARIVETEAYLPDDPASHSYRGPTARNAPMFGRRGHAYVYLNYGMYWLFNISSEETGTGAGVLVRAAEPVMGEAVMALRRPGKAGAALLNGPGKLAAALGIGPAHSGVDLCEGGALRLARPARPAGEIGVSTRIGLTKAADAELRFFERGNTWLSGPKALNR